MIFDIPLLPVTIERFAQLFRCVKLSFIVSGHPYEQNIPYGFSGAIRGTWGNILKLMADSGQSTSPLPRPSAYDIFFRYSNENSHRKLPPPYVFYCEAMDKKNIRIELTLFGTACDWYNDAYMGMCGVFRETIRVGKVHFQIRPSYEHISEYPFTPEFDRECRGLEFLSPVDFRRKHLPAGDFRKIFSALFYRLQHIAYYHHFALCDDPKILLASVKNIPILYHTKPLIWQRFSRQRAGRPYNMLGHIGQIHFKDSPPEIFRLLFQMGEITHIGSYTNFGMGKYRIL